MTVEQTIPMTPETIQTRPAPAAGQTLADGKVELLRDGRGRLVLKLGEARTVVVVKRSLSPGFAGIPNPLFAADNTLMLFEDGKKAVVDIVSAMKASA